MKGQFIVYEDFGEGNLTGIQQKIMSQIKAFNEYGLNCEKKFLPRGDEKCGILIGALFSLVPGVNMFPVWQGEEEFAKLDYLYFRRPLAMTGAMRKFLKRLKERNPDIKVVMELPTYPYDGELKTVLLFPFLWKDRFNRRKLVGLVDAITVIGGEDTETEIWGIPAIPFQNGYDVKSVKIAEKPGGQSHISLCCIAMFQPWHGFERLLLGMEQYYENGGQREIRCHMIGEGQELKRYQKIAESPHLKDRVIFYGRQSGGQLEELYNQMDIGVCSLGMYKINLSGSVSVLKSREYMAKGLPMVTGCKIDVFEGRNVDFICEFNNDDSIIDVNKVVSFYDKMQQKENLRATIRQFALETVDMAHTMKPVVDVIKG